MSDFLLPGYATVLRQKCKSKNLVIIVINTEEFINKSECQKILANNSIESVLVMGSKISNWKSITTY